MKKFFVSAALFIMPFVSVYAGVETVKLTWGIAVPDATVCTNCWPNYIILRDRQPTTILKTESQKEIFLKFATEVQGNHVSLTVTPLRFTTKVSDSAESQKEAFEKGEIAELTPIIVDIGPNETRTVETQGFTFTFTAEIEADDNKS